MRYFVELSYNGRAYHGWQNQPNAISVQEVLENAFSKLLQSQTNIVGAGRTDAGVHANQMIAHFDHGESIDIEKVTYRLNAFLPKDIAISEIFEVHEDAHARFGALSRLYHYRISLKKNVFASDVSYFVKQQLDLDKMNQAAQIMFNYENFKCFSRSNTDVKTYNCKLMKAVWTKHDDMLVFTIQADRFLRNMVRAVVGTLLEIGTEKMEVENMHKIIKSKNRALAGASVPAHGLFLSKIEYPKGIRK